VKTLPNPGHRRSHLITLTRDGERIWSQLRDRQKPLTDMFTAGIGLTPQELERLAGQLRTIRKAAADIGN
jgi:DNA-binding MarR family transcriptional regulator